MQRRRRAVLPIAAACMGLALHSAAAVGQVTIIRGTEISEEARAAAPGKPTIIRGIAPGASWTPAAAPAALPAPRPVAQAGESLWLVDRGGMLLACSLRGSGMVERVSGEVIVCTRARID